MSDSVAKVIIVGSGPAGYTAAIYAARAELQPVLFEGVNAGGQPGGQLMMTTEVENFPGFPDGIMGPQLMMEMKKQAERFKTNIISKDVTKVDFSSKPLKVYAGEEEYQAESVIIATGAATKWLNIESETKLRGYGVSSCATCDGAFFKDKKIIVVGGGDSAMEEALFLTRFASHVTVVHRRDEFRASKIMQERVLNHEKISVEWNSEVVEIKDVSQNKVTGVVLKNIEDGSTKEIEAGGVFVAIGHKPNTDFLKGSLELDDKGYIKVGKGSTTNVEGVFAAGDVHDFTYRQAITAAAAGCKAALDAERYLAEHE